MSQRQTTRERLANVMNKPVTTGTPHNEQMRELSSISAEVMLEVIDTLDKIDETNKALNVSNEKLERSNFRLQVIAVAIATIGVIIAVFK